MISLIAFWIRLLIFTPLVSYTYLNIYLLLFQKYLTQLLYSQCLRILGCVSLPISFYFSILLLVMLYFLWICLVLIGSFYCFCGGGRPTFIMISICRSSCPGWWAAQHRTPLPVFSPSFLRPNCVNVSCKTPGDFVGVCSFSKDNVFFFFPTEPNSSQVIFLISFTFSGVGLFPVYIFTESKSISLLLDF